MSRVACESFVKIQVLNYFRSHFESLFTGGKLADLADAVKLKVDESEFNRQMAIKVNRSELFEMIKPSVLKQVSEVFKMLNHNEALMTPIRVIVSDLVFFFFY